MRQTLNTTDIMATGLMTFALFLGAGNIIFPPLLGHMAGTELLMAMLGFLLTGVGLPLLGVMACAKAGGGLEKLTAILPRRMALLFSVILYSAIGPLFASPRTAVVSYELGLAPFLGEQGSMSLMLFSLVFFAVALYLAMFPGKLLDTIGKFITPMLVAVLVVIAIGAVFFPQGGMGVPVDAMITDGFFSGFREGYQTMDTLGALAFGVVIIKAIHQKGVTESRQVGRYVLIAGLIAAVGLSFVYLVLGYIGATSHSLIADADNGAQIISVFVSAVFGEWGKVILAAVVIMACLTTAVGIMSACGEYFSKAFPAFSYRSWVIICVLISTLIANMGLTALLAFTIPALLAIYPVAITLIVVSLLRERFTNPGQTLVFTLVPVVIISVVDGLNAAGLELVKPAYELLAYLPMQAQGLSWVLPGVAGLLVGLMSTKGNTGEQSGASVA